MTEKSKVYISYLRSKGPRTNKGAKIRGLFDIAGFADFIAQNELTAVKLHVGEAGNDAYVQPVLVRQVVDRIKQAGGRPYLTDTNTLYSGSRHDAVSHLETAAAHGFGMEVTGAPFIVADGLHGNNCQEVEVNLQHFSKVHIAGDIVNAGSMIIISHFKGHELAGFGGALKNLAMGCAPAIGKKAQHELCFRVKKEGCVSCGACIRVCPQHAISMDEAKKAQINPEMCIGCGECLTVCPMGLNPTLLMNLTEYEVWDRAEENYITDCIECGSCSFICPSHRPLLDYIRLGKGKVNTIIRERKN